MAQEAEKQAHSILTKLCGPVVEQPEWLMRPGKIECGDRWELVRSIYAALTGSSLVLEQMPPRERRKVDGVFKYRSKPFVFELDETQHFNSLRATTLALYPTDLRLGFDKESWVIRSKAKIKLETGGFAKPRPPLFPGIGGRHKQRAFRDALADIVPSAHGFLPTLRLDDKDVLAWMHLTDAQDRMQRVLEKYLGDSV